MVFPLVLALCPFALAVAILMVVPPGRNPKRRRTAEASRHTPEETQLDLADDADVAAITTHLRAANSGFTHAACLGCSLGQSPRRRRC